MGLPRVLSRMLSTARDFTSVSEESAEFLNFADLKQAAEDIGRRVAAAGFNPGDRAVLALSDQREFITAFTGMVRAGTIPAPAFPPAPPARTEAHRGRHEDPPKGGNAREAPIGIAADWLTGVWKQCAARLPAVPHSPDGN